MSIPTKETLIASPEYAALTAARHRLIWPLLLLTMGSYFSFILLIAFNPALLSTPIGEGPVSVGILAGLGLIALNFIITGIYVHAANSRIEPLIQKLHAVNGTSHH